jgi:hypothetical protein
MKDLAVYDHINIKFRLSIILYFRLIDHKEAVFEDDWTQLAKDRV